MESSRYPNNSKYKLQKAEEDNDIQETQKPEKPVLTGEKKEGKKTIGRKFMETFLPGDFVAVKDNLVEEVLIPSAIETFSEMCHGIIDGMIFNGEGSSYHKKSGKRRFADSISFNYKKSSAKHRNFSDDGGMTLSRNTPNYKEVLLGSYVDAVKVLDYLNECIDKFERASIGDLYDMMEWDQNYTLEKWGWTDLDNARIKQIRVDGSMWYTIIFPPLEKISK